MSGFVKLDKDCCKLLEDINKIYKNSNYYGIEASSVFAEKYIGLDPTIPDDFSEKTSKELALLAKFDYIESPLSPIPTQYGLEYHHYRRWYYIEKFAIPSALSFIVSLAVNLLIRLAS